jgi:hypothetical protein
VTTNEAIFIAQRMFRLRVQRWPWTEIQKASLHRGLFLDPLVLMARDRVLGFDVFKAKKPPREEGFAPLWMPR